MAYYQQQQQQQHQQLPTTANDSNMFGDLQSSEGLKRFTDLTGVDMNTFSSNPAFSVPRFLQDNFDPAILHAADATSAYPSQSNSSNNNQNHDFRDLNMDYTQSNGAYDNSYGSNAVTASGPYSTLRFPTAPMFPPIPMPPTSYQDATISPVDMMDSSLSSNSSAAVQQKPPRSSALSLNGLPIYSASGFDMLDILARIATRPQPKIAIGPVDMSCAFLVVDVTRDDSPIIYASQTFTELTGYSETETLGRNCRFLQAPPGIPLEKGGAREHTDIDSVTQMAQNVSVNRECQVTLVNYRKSGEAFINCVSIIPIIPSGNEPVRYHVGFQVDLAVQPLAIMRSVQSGTYVTNYSSTPLPPVPLQANKLNVRGLSKDMSDIILRITGSGPSAGVANESQDRHRLSLTLLEECPDAIFVVSLKGSFLYVSPSISRLLDYDADYFLNKNLADICHPSDLAPTMRNVKESTSTTASTSNPSNLNPTASALNDIELLFRARRANGTYVWLDCPGKLHADTSRGRKALLLRLRKVDIPRITWGAINGAGGVYKDDVYLRVAKDQRGLIVACSKSVEEVLGRKRDEVVGKTLVEMVVDDDDGSKIDAVRSAIDGGGLGGADTLCSSSNCETSPPKVVYCNFPASISSKRSKRVKARTGSVNAGDVTTTPNGRVVVLASTELTFFPALESPDSREEDLASAWTSKLRTIIVRIRVLSRRAMRNELNDGVTSSAPTSSYASTSKAPYGTSSSSGPSTSSGFPSRGMPGYGLSTNEMPFNPHAQQMTSPMQLFHSDPSGSDGLGIIRKQGYQVALTGNVNAIEDSIPSSPASSNSYGEAAPAATTTTTPTGSSWLYDLEQLRKRNATLRAELAEVKKDQRSKRRLRTNTTSFTAGTGSSFVSGHGGGGGNSGNGIGHHHHHHSASHSMAGLNALASASGLSAMNARRGGGAPNAVAAAWPVSFPGGLSGNDPSNQVGGAPVGNAPRLSLTMQPPPPPLRSGEDSHKRRWSQTEMHAQSDWHH